MIIMSSATEAGLPMLLGVYIPSWGGAVRVLPGQCLVVGALALALFVYARQRHRPGSTAGSRVYLSVGLGNGTPNALSREPWSCFCAGRILVRCSGIANL